jgi:hypothetical protein
MIITHRIRILAIEEQGYVAVRVTVTIPESVVMATSTISLDVSVICS